MRNARLFVSACLLTGICVFAARTLSAGDPNPRRIKAAQAFEDFDDEDDEDMDDEEEAPPIKPKKKIQQVQMTTVDDDDDFDDDLETDVVENGFGNMGRMSHLAGQTFGRTSSITPFEVMPYQLTNEHFIFGDFRGFVTNNSQLGGNFGIGYRRLFDNWNAWAGASLWYDADNSTSKLYQQIGLSFEALIQQWEFRSNVYIPISSSQTLSSGIGSSTIVGNQLMYTRVYDVATPLTGVDFEAGHSWTVYDRHIIRAFAGGYHFEGGSAAGVNGFKARVEGVINNTFTAQALYTHDNLYGDNLMIGVSLQLPYGDYHPNLGWRRNTPSPFRFVERNYNVIVADPLTTSGPLVATNPTTDRPYFVEQVYSPPTPPSGGTPDGTAAHPFASIAAAQAAGGDVILVQRGSVIDQAVTLAPGQHLFGQGNFNESLPTLGGGNVPIPTGTLPGQPGSGSAPIIQNVTGTAVTMASNSEIAGFTITSATGNGISGNGVSGVSLHDLVFSAIGGDAINLANTSGNVTMGNIQVSSTTGNGIVFNGGTPNITYNNSGSIITAQGTGLVLQNLTGGTNVFNNLLLENNGVSGLSMSGTNAQTTFTNLSVISTSSQPAVSLANVGNTVTLNNVAVNAQNGTGLSANNVSNLQINGGTLAATNAAAIDIESSAVNAKLNSVSDSGGPFGIKLASSTGNFTIQGGSSFASGGTIQNTTIAGVLINSFGNVNLSWVDLTNNAVGIQSTGSSQLAMSGLRINGSTGYGVDSLNDSSVLLSSSIFSGNGASSGGTIRIQSSTSGSFTSAIQSNNITDTKGNAIQLLTQGGGAGSTLTTQILTNTINAYNNGSTAVAINWNGTVLASINNNTIDTFGSNMTAILLQDPSLTNNLTATLTSNSILFDSAAATSGTGISIIDGQSGQTSTGVASLTLLENGIAFDGTGGIGIRSGFYELTNYKNTFTTVTDTVGGATGMLFDNVAGGSNLTMNSNVINLLASDLSTHRGIIFTQLDPNVTFTTATGTASNTVNNASTGQVFVIPAGKGTGGILINGSLVLLPE